MCESLLVLMLVVSNDDSVLTRDDSKLTRCDAVPTRDDCALTDNSTLPVTGVAVTVK